jgi:ribosomal protein S18 acetylase RimI-like enzyme
VRVRRATPADLPSLLVLFQELDRMQRDWRVFTPRPGFYDEIGRKYRAAMHDPDVLIAVAEDAGEVVGMAAAEVRAPSRFSDERTLELSAVVVRSDRRREGIGRELVREALRFAGVRDLPWIELSTFAPNAAAAQFWETLGFTPRVVQLTASASGLAGRLGVGSSRPA